MEASGFSRVTGGNDNVPATLAGAIPMSVRATTRDDHAALKTLYPSAFPTEDLVPLVTRLLAEVPDVLSLVVEQAGAISGHVLFTPCAIDGGTHRIALLGPLAVAPPRQRRGFGTALIGTGLQQLRADGFARVLVLGDPAYYGRFGFTREALVQSPYRLPTEWIDAWQGLALQPNGDEVRGRLRPPAPWMVPALWAP